MSMQLQSTSTVLSASMENIELLTAIKNEPLESEIGIDDIPNSLDEEIIPDVKEIYIVSHELSEDVIKSETITFENNYSGSVETQIFVKTENIPSIKTENITQSEYLHNTQDTRDGNVNRSTSQGVIEVQGSNEHFNALQSDKQFVNFFKDLSDISRKAKCPNKIDFSKCYKTVETTSCEKDKKKGKVIEVPVIAYCCEKCTYTSGRTSDLKRHKLIHLKPEQISYFYCYHCPYKCKIKSNLRIHIFNHFKNEEIPFHCYICDFTTLKRNRIIEHFKKHPKHNSKCEETDYKNQLETYTKKEIRYNYCKKCGFKTYHYERLKLHKLIHKIYFCDKCIYTCRQSSNFKRHQLTHKSKAEIDDRLLKYRCDKCKYKTYRYNSLKNHKLTHLKPEEIQYFYCYHCSSKSKRKDDLKIHIFNHFKKEEVPFHCYICDFRTLSRNKIIEHFKKHPKHHSKCEETDYKNQLETYTKKEIRYCCEKCTYTSGKSSHFKLHQLTHKTKAEIDNRLLKYRCNKCKYRTYSSTNLKNHKLTHLKPEEIQYFYCYHCSYKSKWKSTLKGHSFRHFKKEEIPFHCYICDFVTLKRESFEKHLKHHNKYEETEYKN